MEFHVDLGGATPDLSLVEETIRAVDPAAVVGLDLSGRTLRVSAVVSPAELVALLGQAGCGVTVHQVAQQPSVCCGGCSG